MVIGLLGAVAPDFDLFCAIWLITGNDIIIFTRLIGHFMVCSAGGDISLDRNCEE